MSEEPEITTREAALVAEAEESLPSPVSVRSGILGRVTAALPHGSLRRSLAISASWSLVGAVCSRGFVLLASIAIARLIGQDDFGRYGLVLTTVSMFAQFAGFGLGITATRYVAALRDTDPDRAGKSLSFCLLVSQAATLAASVICALASGLMAGRLYHAPELKLALALASFSLFGNVTAMLLQGALAGFEDFRGIARNNLIQGIVLMCASLPLTWSHGLVGAVLGDAISYCTAAVLGFRLVLRRSHEHGMRIRLAGAWSQRHILWQFAAPGILTAAVAGPASMLAQAMLAWTPGGLAGLGSYQAATRWRGFVLFAPNAVRSVTLPMLARLREGGEYRRMVRALMANIGVNGGIALAGALPVMLLSPWILSLYGPGFRKDWDVLVVLIGWAVIQAVNDVVTQVTAAMEKMWWNFGIHVVWASIVVGGSALLVPRFGVRGYAWSLTGAAFNHMLLNSVAAAVLLRRKATAHLASSAVPA